MNALLLAIALFGADKPAIAEPPQPAAVARDVDGQPEPAKERKAIKPHKKAGKAPSKSGASRVSKPVDRAAVDRHWADVRAAWEQNKKAFGQPPQKREKNAKDWGGILAP